MKKLMLTAAVFSSVVAFAQQPSGCGKPCDKGGQPCCEQGKVGKPCDKGGQPKCDRGASHGGAPKCAPQPTPPPPKAKPVPPKPAPQPAPPPPPPKRGFWQRLFGG